MLVIVVLAIDSVGRDLVLKDVQQLPQLVAPKILCKSQIISYSSEGRGSSLPYIVTIARHRRAVRAFERKSK